MKKFRFHKIYLLILLIILLITGWGITIYYLIDILGSIRYIPALFAEEPSSICKYKQINWSNNRYQIQTTRIPEAPTYLSEPLYIQIDNYNKESWNYMFDAIGGDQLIGEAAFNQDKFGSSKYHNNLNKHYTFCAATIISPRQYAPKDLQQSAKGVVVSIRNQNNQSFTILTMSVSLFAFRYTDEDYNFDAAMRDLANSFVLEQKSNGALVLSLQVNYERPKAFHYLITKVNDTFVTDNFVQLISYDNGQTWKPIIDAGSDILKRRDEEVGRNLRK